MSLLQYTLANLPQRNTKYNSVFLLLLSSTLQLSLDVLADAGFVCDKAAMLGVVIKERPCPITNLWFEIVMAMMFSYCHSL
jgi:hypothetical protein